MATATEILQDPNYVNANAETKKAIFDKHIGTTPEYTSANQETQLAIKSRFGIESAPPETTPQASPVESFNSSAKDGRTNIPQWARNYPSLYGIAGAARETLGPLVEGGAMIGGTILGTPGGPPGNVAGGALGFGIGKGVTRVADLALGNVAPESAGQELMRGGENVLEGAAWQAGGNIAAPYIGKGLAWAGGKLADLGQMSKQSATLIAKKALGPDLAEALRILSGGKPLGKTTASQLTEGIQNPTWHAIIDRALKRDPRFLALLEKSQGEVSEKALREIAGGTTQTASLDAQKIARQVLNERLIPTLDTELGAANIAGKLKPKLDFESQRMADAAAAKVQDVRAFTAAGERASGVGGRAHATTYDAAGNPVAATTTVPGYPRQPGRYTYMGELGKKAEQVAQQSADASLPFGEASRFAQAASDSLAAHGLKPLTAEAITSKLGRIASDPKLAGLAEVDAALSKLSSDIKQWTNSGGVIDAWALDAIRKNSVNGAIQKLHPTMDATQQKRLAATVMSDVKPIMVRAIEEAGGTGYGSYLKDYAVGAQKIAQKELGAEALKMYRNSPDSFVDLVEGNSPDVVEKIFGPGSYDIAKEMSRKAMGQMRLAAQGVSTAKTTAEQAQNGQAALENLMKSQIIKFRLPNYLNVAATSTNKALQYLEGKIGIKTMDALTEAFKSGKGTKELLSRMPAGQRIELLKQMADPEIQKLLGNLTPGGLLSQPQQQHQGLLYQ